MQESVQRDLRKRRDALGLTRLDIAARAECSPGFIQMVEGGYTPKQSKTLDRIIAVLDEEEKATA